MAVLVQGGDEFHQACRPMDQALLEIAGDGPVVIYPGASEDQYLQAASAHAMEYYQSLGADVTVAPVDPQAAVAALAPARTVVLPGGSPALLLERLEAESGALAEVLRAVLLAGGAINGSSAGAMVLGALTWLPETDQVVPGLGLLPWLVLPHADATPTRWLHVAENAQALDPAIHCLALAEHAGLLVAGGQERTFGSVYRWE